MGLGAVVAYFKSLPLDLHRGVAENHEQFKCVVKELAFEGPLLCTNGFL
jgi:hypothetical protein